MARGPEKWSDMVLIYHGPCQSAACSSSGFNAGCWSASWAAGSSEYSLESLLQALGLLDLRQCEIVQGVKVTWLLASVSSELPPLAGRQPA